MQRLNFRPMLIDSLKGYTRQGLTRDLLAGLIVGIVALPMAIAFAIASGVSPEVGRRDRRPRGAHRLGSRG